MCDALLLVHHLVEFEALLLQWVQVAELLKQLIGHHSPLGFFELLLSQLLGKGSNLPLLCSDLLQ